MSPKSRRIPKYRLYRPKNLAVVRIDRHDHYLGKHGSPESYERYHRLIAEWLSGTDHRPAVKHSVDKGAISVNQLILAFWKHAQGRYVKDGQPTSEIRSYRTALRPLRQLYGHTPVEQFGPLALIACRQKLIEAGICRKRINGHVTRIRHMFKWGVAREILLETVWRALCAVEGLRYGEALETEPIKPVPEEHIAAIEPFVSPQISAMVNLQLWTACRPGEVCNVRTIDITMLGDVWEYRPRSHKAEHHGKQRVIYLGPHAQEVILPWLKPKDTYDTQPAEAPSEKKTETRPWRTLQHDRIRSRDWPGLHARRYSGLESQQTSTQRWHTHPPRVWR
jgi:integrase